MNATNAGSLLNVEEQWGMLREREKENSMRGRIEREERANAQSRRGREKERHLTHGTFPFFKQGGRLGRWGAEIE